MGSLIAGKLSDKLIAAAKPGQGFVGRRLFVVNGSRARPRRRFVRMVSECRRWPHPTERDRRLAPFPQAHARSRRGCPPTHSVGASHVASFLFRQVRGYLVGLALALLGLAVLPNVWWMQWGTIFMVGFFLYGPQMLIGLCGMGHGHGHEHGSCGMCHGHGHGNGHSGLLHLRTSDAHPSICGVNGRVP